MDNDTGKINRRVEQPSSVQQDPRTTPRTSEPLNDRDHVNEETLEIRTEPLINFLKVQGDGLHTL